MTKFISPGLRPGTLTKPLAALTEPSSAVPGGGVQSTLPCGTCYPCPGEDHLKRRRRVRRIVPSPRSPPLLGCRHCSTENASCRFAANHRFSPGDARGGAPCIRKLKISPFPPGRGWGMGAESKLKAWAAGDIEGKPPPGGANAGRASAAPLASPGLTPGGTGEGGEPRARRGLARLGSDYPLCVISRDPAYPQHIVHKDPVPGGRIMDQHVRYGTDQLAALQDRAAGHPCTMPPVFCRSTGSVTVTVKHLEPVAFLSIADIRTAYSPIFPSSSVQRTVASPRIARPATQPGP